MAAAASLGQALESLERARQLSDIAAQRVAESCAALLRNKADAAVAFAHSARGRGRAPTARDVADIEQLQMLYDVAQSLCEARAGGEDVENDLLELGREYHRRQRASPHSRAATTPGRSSKSRAGRRRGSRAARQAHASEAAEPAAAASSTITVNDSRTAVPPVELGVLVLPELRHLLPGRLGLEALASSRALQADHVTFVANALRDLPGAAGAIAARSDRSAAGMPLTALSFASLPNGA
jgi:hypothetical protein